MIGGSCKTPQQKCCVLQVQLNAVILVNKDLHESWKRKTLSCFRNTPKPYCELVRRKICLDKNTLRFVMNYRDGGYGKIVSSHLNILWAASGKCSCLIPFYLFIFSFVSFILVPHVRGNFLLDAKIVFMYLL